MSKTTFAIIAAAGAATGAGVTALLYSTKPTRQPTPSPTAALPVQALNNPTTPVPNPIPAPPALAAKAIAAVAPVDPSGLLQYGFPGPVIDPLNTLPLTGAYDRRMRNPSWVAEHITPYSLSLKNADRKHSVFVEDTTIPVMFRGKLSDYFRSGYDRGHQVPAADAKWSQDAMDATFALSNMCPQVGEGFNRDYWAHFEDFCRNLTKTYPSVRIVTGPLYLPRKEADGKYRVTYEVIGEPPNIAVPTHFYKVIFAEHGTNPTDKVALGAFVLPNARIPNTQPLTDFEVPVEAVERASGLEFATKLDVSRRRRLCQEVRCDIVVREFNNSQKSLPVPKR
ncbi:mitochondrial inner membrane nuclease Nuc1, putative [Talaromyces stipitatus ATCC 10500]|uniref:Endonuclease n=1 Tax=Talaromyces stipitatus (strain ATCC 10500 / CBS 375.48 / QM 6759 / NRRL 1006) TaxID=441959 RepID=B8M2J7_TALSN|nr:mitochondrial inner membrane nuclease Nuc1, putative [Talaromyces stipitatus ATCC 10500]EED21908.1 mitochondrial inner membrane nuclease Nuc1, putative [Talaromyces stipitatus ATCC 10500]